MSLFKPENMTIAEIIEKLQEAVDLGDSPHRGPFGTFIRKEYLVEAIEALKANPDAQPNEPLTLEELKGMYCQAVWVQYEDGIHGSWGFVELDQITLPAGAYCIIREDSFGTGWKAYRRPPKED